MKAQSRAVKSLTAVDDKCICVHVENMHNHVTCLIYHLTLTRTQEGSIVDAVELPAITDVQQAELD